MFAIELSASIFCARLMRGTMSIAMAVAPLSLTLFSSSSFCAGQKNEISVWPSRSMSASASVGGRTLTTTSAAFEDLGAAAHDLHIGLTIGVIGELRPRSGTGLDKAGMAQLLELPRAVGRHRHPRLALERLLERTDLHELRPPILRSL